MDPEQHFIGPEDSIFRVNPYDEAALELALKIKDQKGDVEIILLTLGPIIAETELRCCLALGADELFQIETEEELDPWSKSKFLARASKDMNPDLILCGKESLDKQDGQVGAFMAHHLDIPFRDMYRACLLCCFKIGRPYPEKHSITVQSASLMERYQAVQRCH